MTALSNPSGSHSEPPVYETTFDFLEPWRCESCNELIYNKDGDGYPTPGAPIGIAVKLDKQMKRICLVCAEMYIVILKSPYMLKQHKEWVEENKHKDKLRFGRNYLDK